MKHILVSDDNPGIRTFLRNLLEDAGYLVDEAPEGSAGLKQYAHHLHDLVITDIIMPGTEGIETIVRLKQSNPDIKVIAMSDGGRLRTAQRYLKMASGLGAKIVQEKPLIGPLVSLPPKNYCKIEHPTNELWPFQTRSIFCEAQI